jgi:hypothetical protein
MYPAWMTNPSQTPGKVKAVDWFICGAPDVFKVSAYGLATLQLKHSTTAGLSAEGKTTKTTGFISQTKDTPIPGSAQRHLAALALPPAMAMPQAQLSILDYL